MAHQRMVMRERRTIWSWSASAVQKNSRRMLLVVDKAGGLATAVPGLAAGVPKAFDQRKCHQPSLTVNYCLCYFDRSDKYWSRSGPSAKDLVFPCFVPPDYTAGADMTLETCVRVMNHIVQSQCLSGQGVSKLSHMALLQRPRWSGTCV